MGADAPAPPPQESTAKMLDSFAKSFPTLLRITNEAVPKAAQAQLNANQLTAPGFAELNQKLYDAYGPLLGDTANRIQAAQQKSQAASDLDTLNGPGGQLIEQARKVAREEDPEYYKSREQLGGRLGDLLGSIDLSGKISGGEREEITRSLNRDNLNRGIQTNTPSMTNTVENAVTFGNASHNRQLQAQDTLGKALQVGTGFLPASRSGVDPFQVGTGRSSVANAGDTKFTGVNPNLGSSANELGANVLGQVGGFVNNANEINANRRDELDRFNQTFSGVVGSL